MLEKVYLRWTGAMDKPLLQQVYPWRDCGSTWSRNTPETLQYMGKSKLEQRQGEGSGVANGDILDSVGPEHDVNSME